MEAYIYYKGLHTNVNSSFTHNIPKHETTYISFLFLYNTLPPNLATNKHLLSYSFIVQEFGSRLAGLFWLWVSHEATVI